MFVLNMYMLPAEVMKLFNAVAAGVAGEIVQICVEDAALVEYDQVLMRVRPA